MLPAAPGRFSTTRGWPRPSAILGAMRRATTSAPPPGGYGTIRRTGFDGYCAKAASGKRRMKRKNRTSNALGEHRPGPERLARRASRLEHLVRLRARDVLVDEVLHPFLDLSGAARLEAQMRERVSFHAVMPLQAVGEPPTEARQVLLEHAGNHGCLDRSRAQAVAAHDLDEVGGLGRRVGA